MLEDRHNPVGSAYQRQPSPRLRRADQPDTDRRPVVEHVGAIGPLDDGDRVGRRLIQTRVHPGHPIQTIEVVMLDGEAALVAVVQDEGWTVHAARDAERLCDALHQLRLPRTEITFERDDIARLEDLSKAAAEVAGLLHRSRLNESVRSRLLRRFRNARRSEGECPAWLRSRRRRSREGRYARGHDGRGGYG